MTIGSESAMLLSSGPAIAGFNRVADSLPMVISLLDVDFPPVPGLWSLANSEFAHKPNGVNVLCWLDRIEFRALALEMDLAGCLDSGLA